MLSWNVVQQAVGCHTCGVLPFLLIMRTVEWECSAGLPCIGAAADLAYVYAGFGAPLLQLFLSMPLCIAFCWHKIFSHKA